MRQFSIAKVLDKNQRNGKMNKMKTVLSQCTNRSTINLSCKMHEA